MVVDFLRSHDLPASFRDLITDHYAPLVTWLTCCRTQGQTMMLGINGAQGTGKSTLADFLKLALESLHRWRVAVLSIDDFYLTRAERADLAESVHPLLVTRGVPGTHDTDMLQRCLDELCALRENETRHLPRFDKSRDDRAAETEWPLVGGPVDLIILEGWCVGSVAETTAALETSVNDLESKRDPDGRWRRYVNSRLTSDYAQVFSRLDALVFLRAPSFEAVYRWRLEQEHKLAASVPAAAPGIMDDGQVAEFIQYFERITRHNLSELATSANVVLEFDERHNCIASRYYG